MVDVCIKFGLFRFRPSLRLAQWASLVYARGAPPVPGNLWEPPFPSIFFLRKRARATGVGNPSELGYWAYAVPTKYPIPRAAFAGKRVVPCVVPEGMIRLFST